MLSVIVSMLKMCQTRFPPGHRPGLDPTTGAHDAPPDPLVRWGGGHVPLDSSPIDAYGISISASLAPRLIPPLANKAIAK